MVVERLVGPPLVLSVSDELVSTVMSEFPDCRLTEPVRIRLGGDLIYNTPAHT